MTVTTFSFKEMFRRLLSAEGRSRAAKAVEVFGWLILVESIVMVFAPHIVVDLLRIPSITGQGENYFRLAGMLVGGLGMLYIVSGRLNSAEFVFASLLDRPLVPVVMAVLWYLSIIPGALALAFSIQDLGSFLLTLAALRKDGRSRK